MSMSMSMYPCIHIPIHLAVLHAHLLSRLLARLRLRSRLLARPLSPRILLGELPLGDAWGDRWEIVPEGEHSGGGGVVLVPATGA